MSFWDLSNGEKPTGEVQENDFSAIPKGDYKCIVEEAKIDTYNEERKIKFKARVVGDGFGKNRVLFMALKVFDSDSKKRDRAINLLVKWANVLGVALPKSEPGDMWLSKLTDKPLSIKIDTFKFTKDNGEEVEGNFVINFDSVSAKVGASLASANPVTGIPVTDDDIPF